MRKIRLNVQDLVVTSFAVQDSGAASRGTIMGHATRPRDATCDGFCPPLTQAGCPDPSYDASCPESCTCPIESVCIECGEPPL